MFSGHNGAEKFTKDSVAREVVMELPDSLASLHVSLISFLSLGNFGIIRAMSLRGILASSCYSDGAHSRRQDLSQRIEILPKTTKTSEKLTCVRIVATENRILYVMIRCIHAMYTSSKETQQAHNADSKTNG